MSFMLSIPFLSHLSCLLLYWYRLMQEVMLEADFKLNLHIEVTDSTTPHPPVLSPQRRQNRREAKTEIPGDSAGRPKGNTLLFCQEVLLAKLAPVAFEGPLPAFLSSQGCFALPCLCGKQPTQSSLPLMPMGTLGLLPSPPTSLTHVVFSSLSSLPNCLKECFLPSLPPFASRLLCGRTHRAGALLCIHTILLFKSCSEQELFLCSLNETFWFPALGAYRSTAPV